MGPGSNAEIEVRLTDANLAKKLIGHSFSVVLSRMDEDRPKPGLPIHLSDQRGDLHEIRPRPNDVEDFHGLLLRQFTRCHAVALRPPRRRTKPTRKAR